MGALTAPVPVPSVRAARMVSAAAITQVAFARLDRHRVDVDPDYVFLQLLQGLCPRQTA